MDFRNELADYQDPNDDEFIKKIEPIEVDFIKEEKIEEEESCVDPGIIALHEVGKDSVKKEAMENHETNNCSSSNV